MKAIAKLKDDARKHEQKEEWEKAIQAYLEVLKIGEQGDGAELDLPLYNRVGDLYVRLGRPSDAVTYYEQAADRYAEAGLFNNAIALCNKALRYDAGRLELFKKLGSFSASQGFFTDARRWYLEYAEKSIKRNQLDEAFAALSEYANVNDDADIRELLARQLKEHGRTEQAVQEYTRAYSIRITAGQQAEADAIRAEVAALDPSVVLSDTPNATPHHAARAEQLPGFADIDRVVAPPAPPAAKAPAAAVEEAEPEALEIEQTALSGGLDASDGAGEYGSIELDAGLGGENVDTTDVAPLDVGLEAPLGIEAEDLAEAGLELPTLDDETPADEEAEAEAMELPGFDDFSTDDMGGELPMLEGELGEEIEPLPGFDGLDVEGELPALETADFGALDVGELERDEVGLAGAPLPTIDLGSTDLTAPEAEEVEKAEEAAEFEESFELPSFDELEEKAEAEPEAEAPLEAETAPAPPAPAPEPPAPVAPAASAPTPAPEAPAPAPEKKKPEYVDLASFLNDEDEAVDSTRFVVAEKPPTGDEEQDFADMLAQFKEKVAEVIPKEDAGSHYDLGIAFKEMGLIDEAIGEFQTALRAGQEKLKVYEELGSCFVQKGQYSVAITILNRAQSMPFSDEQELLGVYYNLGRAYEELGQRADAKAAYEKIIAIDIGFQDTTSRLSRL